MRQERVQPVLKYDYTCSFCGHQFGEEERVETCSRCAVFGAGGCHKIRCPKCNYETSPPPRLPALVARLAKKIIRK